jgi:hypothetical protein
VQPDKDGLALAVGYGLMRDGARVGGAGLRSLLTPTRLPAEATPARAAMAQADLAQAMIPLAQQAAARSGPHLNFLPFLAKWRFDDDWRFQDGFACACVSLLVAPIPASAQLGGLGRKMLSGGAQAGAQRGCRCLLANAVLSTKNVTASALIAQTLTNSKDLASRRARSCGEQRAGYEATGRLSYPVAGRP